MSGASNWAKNKLGHSFNDPALMQRALTHKSRSARNYERLEFLGDAVLGLVIADAIYRSHPQRNEEFLTRWRSRLVRGETLADIAEELGIEHYLSLGQGEHRRRSILADVLEALYGAVYLDAGYARASEVILGHYAQKLLDAPQAESLKDPKTQLQETLQGRGLELPEYRLVDESGPEHAPTFTVNCAISALAIDTEGRGSSRRKAEQRAAAKALRRISGSDEHAS